jgi:hypothetical protein
MAPLRGSEAAASLNCGLDYVVVISAIGPFRGPEAAASLKERDDLATLFADDALCGFKAAGLIEVAEQGGKPPA